MRLAKNGPHVKIAKYYLKKKYYAYVSTFELIKRC
jgi:hypothetical protein